MNDDLALVREYAQRNSEEAFATLVSRHLTLVYSVALRHVRDPDVAEEDAQASFVSLARKAASLGPKTFLPGSLCGTPRYAAANARSVQQRRQLREREACMESVANESGAEPGVWDQIGPLLDAAMERLGRKDHDALVLRFFEGMSFSEIGAALGASEDAAKKRVSRALERLRAFFAKRGISSTTGMIAEAVSANSIQTAPAALAKSLAAVAATKGAASSASTLTLVKGALKLMAWTNAKPAIVGGTAAVLLGIGAVMVGGGASGGGQALAGNGLAVVVRGEIRDRTFQANGSVQSDSTIPFEALVGGRRWRITVDHGRNRYVETVGCEGTDTFSLSKFSRAATIPSYGGPPDLYLPSGYVFPSSYPYMSFPATRYAWLAYGSAAFLRTNRTYLPLVSAMSFNDPAQLAVVVSRCDLMPGGLPRLVRWKQDLGAIDVYAKSPYLMSPWRTARAIAEGRKQVERAARAGAIWSAEYRATATTNVAGLTIPTAFEFRIHLKQHLPRGPGVDYDCVVVTGTVTQVARRSGPRFTPPISGDITVRDYRFRAYQVDQISYKDTNRVWLGTNNPQLQAAFAIAKANHPPPPHTRAFGLWVEVLCLAVLVLPLFGWRLWRGRSAQQR